MKRLALCALVFALAPALGGQGGEPSPARRYQQGWYQEHGLHDIEGAVDIYRQVAESPGAEPEVAAKALLRMAACYRRLGEEEAASEAEVAARRRFPDAVEGFPTYRLEVLHKQLDEAFDVADSATASQAIVNFLESLEPAAVHSVCESCYGEALRLRAAEPLASIPAYRKAIAISTYLRQLERSAFAQKDIGDIYASEGRYEEALAAYRKVQDDFPEVRKVGAWAQLSIAEVHRLQGHLAEAVEAYRAVERKYPNQVRQALWAHLWMGDAFRAADKMADARGAWRRVLEDFNEPAYAEPIALAARLLGQAAPGTRVRLPQDEFANDTAYLLAVSHEMQGEEEKAKRYYRLCLRASTGNDWPRPLAARALEAAKEGARPPEKE
ncbi:MAG: tetratricopeptide repeat protein [Candidatus Brocadiia bacterium]